MSRISISSSISPVRTGHCRRRIHQRHCRRAVVKVNEQAVFFALYPLPFIDIDQCTRSITSCFRHLFTRAAFARRIQENPRVSSECLAPQCGQAIYRVRSTFSWLRAGCYTNRDVLIPNPVLLCLTQSRPADWIVFPRNHHSTSTYARYRISQRASVHAIHGQDVDLACPTHPKRSVRGHSALGDQSKRTVSPANMVGMRGR